MAFVVLMAGACGAAFLDAAVTLAGASSVLGRLLDFWVCGDADEATRLVLRGLFLAEAALAAEAAEYEYFGAEDELDGGAVLAEAVDCFATVFFLSSSAANLSDERFVMISGSMCDAQNEIHWSARRQWHLQLRAFLPRCR